MREDFRGQGAELVAGVHDSGDPTEVIVLGQLKQRRPPRRRPVSRRRSARRHFPRLIPEEATTRGGVATPSPAAPVPGRRKCVAAPQTSTQDFGPVAPFHPGPEAAPSYRSASPRNRVRKASRTGSFDCKSHNGVISSGIDAGGQRGERSRSAQPSMSPLADHGDGSRS